MVKLAETRTKKRYNLVPRGKALYEDDSRFGVKMLEKMGWTKGKGLGAREEGSKDFVQVRYKNDAEGLGYEARDDQWTQHEETFNGLLMSLSANTNSKQSVDSAADSDVENRGFGLGFTKNVENTDSTSLKAKISGQSLEERSKQSKARVHYKKFTRGKDLAQYSEKDLANIFGKKAIENAVTNEKCQEKDIIENELGTFQSSTLSVNDYFKQKMEILKKKKTKKLNEKEFSTENENQAIGEEIKESKEKLKKKKKKKETTDNEKDAAENENNHSIKKIKLENQSRKEENVKESMEVTSKDNAESLKGEKYSNKKEKLRHDETNVELNINNEITNKERKKKKKTKSKNNPVNVEMEIKESDQPEPKYIKEKIHTDADKKTNKRERTNSTNEEIVKNEKLKVVYPTDIKEEIGQGYIATTEKPAVCDTAVEKAEVTTQEMLEELQSSKVLKISSCVAEQFRFADFGEFKGANIGDIRGYSIPANVKLQVVKLEKDPEKILRLWTNAINKYERTPSSKNDFKQYAQLVRKARANNEKLPRFKTHKFSKRNAFKLVTI